MLYFIDLVIRTIIRNPPLDVFDHSFNVHWSAPRSIKILNRFYCCFMLQIRTFVIMPKQKFASIPKVSIDDFDDRLAEVCKLLKQSLLDFFEVPAGYSVSIVSLIIVVDKHF
jgi:hypothetical protein